MFRLLFASLILAVVILAAPNPTFADKEEWKPVDPAQLMMKSPVVEKDADAEALFWEIKVEDEVEGSTPRTVLSNYIRIKIFTERGRGVFPARFRNNFAHRHCYRTLDCGSPDWRWSSGHPACRWFHNVPDPSLSWRVYQ